MNLAAHLGHKVTVTGVTSREEKEENEKKEAKEQGEREYADLNVTNLKMVSQTCQ